MASIYEYSTVSFVFFFSRGDIKMKIPAWESIAWKYFGRSAPARNIGDRVYPVSGRIFIFQFVNKTNRWLDYAWVLLIKIIQTAYGD